MPIVYTDPREVPAASVRADDEVATWVGFLPQVACLQDRTGLSRPGTEWRRVTSVEPADEDGLRRLVRFVGGGESWLRRDETVVIREAVEVPAEPLPYAAELEAYERLVREAPNVDGLLAATVSFEQALAMRALRLADAVSRAHSA